MIVSGSFDESLQQRFAAVSGDYNEIHMDPIAARRSLAGRRVVHGIHVLLWALDGFVSGRRDGIGRVAARFRKPIFLDETVDVEVVEDLDATARLSIEVDRTPAIDVELELVSSVGVARDDRAAVELPRQPRQLGPIDVERLAGSLEIPDDEGKLDAMFPGLVSRMGSVVPAHVVALSRLVGMVCPGRHSMLSGLDVTLDGRGVSTSFDWRVAKVDNRVGAVTMEVSGGALTGTVDAFILREPAPQATFEALRELVAPDEFVGQRALVVGGSRGIGEVTAKLVAAGGGHAMVTWRVGSDDAARVVAEILAGGGTADSLQLDVTRPDELVARLRSLYSAPSHVYYFATPKIFDRRTRFFDARLFSDYVDVYVTGFADVLDACRMAGSERIAAFYPSSVAVDEQVAALTEYAAAKAAGEAAAKALAANHRWLDVAVERLPRVQTDQTASILPVPAVEAAPVMLGVIRRMSDRATG